jgi:hypothetical protein
MTGQLSYMPISVCQHTFLKKLNFLKTVSRTTDNPVARANKLRALFHLSTRFFKKNQLLLKYSKTAFLQRHYRGKGR